MGAVAVGVGVAAEGSPGCRGTALELGVTDGDARVDNVGVGSGTGVGVVDVAGGALAAVGNSS